MCYLFNVKGGALIPVLRLERAYKMEQASGAGTFRFQDYRGGTTPFPRWVANLQKSRSTVELYYTNDTDNTYWKSAQTDKCIPDFATTFDGTANPADSVFTNVYEGEIISGGQGGTPLALPSEYTTARLTMYGRSAAIPSLDLTSQPGYIIVATPIQTAKVEILKPRRGDLDGNGQMTLGDFTIFKQDYALGAALCQCPTYWP